MATNAAHQKYHSKSRRGRGDLIDLSSDKDDNNSVGKILLVAEFDPLNSGCSSSNSNARSSSRELDRARSTSRKAIQLLELRKRDKRSRATSVCVITRTNDLDTQTIKLEKEAERIEDCGRLRTAKRSSTTASHNSATSTNSSTNSSVENELDGGGLAKLTLRPSHSENLINEKLYDNLANSGCGSGSNSKTDLEQVLDDKTLTRRSKSNINKLKLGRKHQRSGPEIVLLTEEVKSFRAKFKHDDRKTNSGLVFSPTLYSSKVRNMSVKICITSPMAKEPINFTCDASTTVEHLISHAVCSMFERLKSDDSMDNYMLKVTGKDEYFDSKLCLADYGLVTHCWKFDVDVKLTLIRTELAKRIFLRTKQDDFRNKSRLCPDDVLSRTSILKYSDLNYESLAITIDMFEREAQRLYFDTTNRSTCLQTQSLLQVTKAICSLMLNCETSQLSEAKDNLTELCRSYKDEGNNLADEDRYKMIEVIQHAIKRLVENMHRLLRLTSSSLPVDFEVVDTSNAIADKRQTFVNTSVDLIKEHVSIRVHLISQLKPDWLAKYHEFHLLVSVAHGDQEISPEVASSTIRADKSFFQRLLFDEDLILPITYSNLPREARLVMTLMGTEMPSASGSVASGNILSLPIVDEPLPLRRTGSATSINSTSPMYSTSPRGSIYSQKNAIEPVQVALAQTTAYLFNHELDLYQGDRLLSLHPVIDSKLQDIYLEVTPDRNEPILFIEFKRFPPEKRVFFPKLPVDLESKEKSFLESEIIKEFEQLDGPTKYVLSPIIYEKQAHEDLMDDEKTLLWENRYYLTGIPAAFPKLMQSVPSWSAMHLKEIYQLVDRWKHLDAVDAMQLLLPSFPDAYVRQVAVSWIDNQHDDELCDYLPQLLQALRYEKSLDCSLFWLLIRRSLQNARIGNLLYWQLKLNSSDRLLQERSETITNCVLQVNGAAFWMYIDKQVDLLAKLASVSNDVKKNRDSSRMSVLHSRLEQIRDYLMEKRPTLPWAPSLEVCDLELKSCSYFPSNTLPLKLAFRSCEESCNKQVKFYSYGTIFKMGDDLRQDMLAIQIIRIMEKLWLREGLDLRMVTFDCIATGERQGMMELVQNAETLRKIQQSSSLFAGSFNPKAIDSYIRLWNTSELEYKTALDNFLHSCAGYSVATYILGICDRHNDNIMVTTAGHLFHIDFGKFLGDSQMMGAIKRDRTPFVLTADMAYVINGGDRPSKKFQTFIELCTMGFNIIRRHKNLFLNLFSLMSSANINGLDKSSVSYINKMLMPNLSETEAMAKFSRLIDECLNSRSAQVNFFIHNLAQLRFSSDNSKQSLLSFVPKTFSMQTDGRIESLDLLGLYKVYEPEKQYYYVVRVKRYNQPDATEVRRTFREFSEFQMKLISTYPGGKFHDITKSTSSFLMDLVGRNNTREIAERRFIELKTFLAELLRLEPQIAQCDLVHTFFHPILRDQSSNNGDLTSFNESSSSTFGSQEYSDAQRSALYLGSKGQVKLSFSYKNASLIIMIMHAKNLPTLEGSIEPNCYAKTYLLPDPHKQTKRKTKVVRSSCHPSFMDLIVYNIPQEALKHLTLQVSLWHSELVQYKTFVGAALIPFDKVDLSRETTGWFPLKNY